MAERNSAGRRLEQYLPDVVRRTLVAGLGAVLLTEEGLRSALSDLKLPKEAIAYLAAQADRSKRELSNAIARELRSFLDGVDLSRVLRRVLAGMTLEFTTQVRFVPNDPAVDHEDGHGSEGGERTGAGARRSRRPVRPAADAREGRRRKGVFSIHHDDERSP
ncbi:MAG: hypothetical protein JXR83_07495 [Deltaproteobacteria bacterium]|nr:hypothetical protein [Deltaproteobacteria bacterium]